MGNKIKTAIVGCGKIAHFHASALKKSQQSEFVSVLSRSKEKAENFASKYNVHPFNNFDDLIKSKIQAVIICNPHPYHKEIVCKAAQHGIHCLVEKPLASSLQDCDEMINACKQNHVKLSVISQKRFYLPVQRMKKAIDEGKIGKPSLVVNMLFGWRDKNYYLSDEWRGKWKTEGGGILVNQAPHQIDIMQWLLGPIDEIYGTWKNINHDYIEVEDTAVAIIKFKNGAIGNLILSNSQKPGIFGKIHVHGDNGATVGVQIEGPPIFINGMPATGEPPFNDIWTIEGEENMLDKWKKQDIDFFKSVNNVEYFLQLQHEDFFNAIDKNIEPFVSGKDARTTVEIFTAIYRSKRDNKVVKFPLEPEISRTDFDGRLF